MNNQTDKIARNRKAYATATNTSIEKIGESSKRLRSGKKMR